MKLREQYDWIVLGEHPGALLSASLAGRLGLSVLVLGLAPGARVQVSQSNQHLDPESNFVVGLGKGSRGQGLLLECLGKLGMQSAEAGLLESERCLPQVATPDFRLLLQRDDERLGLELMRELGRGHSEKLGLRAALKEAGEEFQGYWSALPERLTLLSGGKRKTPASAMSLEELKRKLDRAGRGHAPAGFSWLSDSTRSAAAAERLGRGELKEALSALWFGSTLSVSEDPPLGELLHALSMARTGASFRGGMTAYRDYLLRLAQRQGAHVPPKSECRRIFVENGRFKGIQISQKGNMISAGGGILGCSLAHAAERLSVEGRGWLKKLKPAPAPSGWKFTLAITAGAEAVPPGMSTRLVWKEPGAPVLEVEIADPSDYGSNEPGARMIFARTVLPFTQESLAPDYQRMTSARMMRQLSELFPFLEYHVRKVFPDFRKSPEEGSLQELSESYAFAMPELIPENLRCFAQDTAGVGARSGIDGLFVATGESFPALGGLGATVAAVEAVSWAAHKAGLAGPLV